MSAVLLPADPDTTTAAALRWTCRGDTDMARTYLAKLSPVQFAEARMHVTRLALLMASMTPAGVAAAVLQPDTLPEGVDGYQIAGRPL